MNPHAVFLRKECILPEGLHPVLQNVGDNWSVVEEYPALVFDTMVRQAGWLFIWLQGACSRRGYGLTQESATRRALLCALKEVPKQFNAAELDSVFVTEYPGFLIVSVRVQPLQIQQHTPRNFVDELHLQAVLAK